jgi:hypothetical protein
MPDPELRQEMDPSEPDPPTTVIEGDETHHEPRHGVPDAEDSHPPVG